MLKKLLPQKKDFFLYFQQSADLLYTATGEFYHAVQNITDVNRSVELIAEYEAQGDKIAHTTFRLLHKTFITPFDRHDIHRLVSCLDELLDLLHSCAQRLPYYHLDSVPKELIQLAELCVRATGSAREAVYRLHSLDLSEEIFKYCHEIGMAQDEAHKLVVAGEQDLFANEHDFKEFFKRKDLYARIKTIINLCHTLANIVKDIVLEYS